MEPTRLQRNFEGSMHEIELLEKSRTSMPCAAALAVGFGRYCFYNRRRIFSGCSSASYFAMYPACHSGIHRLGSAVFYSKSWLGRNDIVNPLIEQEIWMKFSELCRKGSNLL